MELSQIRYFLHLADTLNFTEAARRSGIAQPSLTKSIQRLEEELGASLIYRDGKDTRLTALGREIQAKFMQVDALVHDTRELAETTVAGRTRELKIGLAVTIAPKVIAVFIGHIMTQLPSVELTITQMRADENEDAVLAGIYDLCLLPNPPAENPKLAILPVFVERLMLGLSENHPLAQAAEVSAQQMAEETYIERLHCEFRTQLTDHFMNRNVVMRPRIQSDREDWVQYLVAAGVGICGLPERSAMAAGLAVRPIGGLNLSRQVTLVAVSGSGNPREVRQILDLARQFDWTPKPAKPQASNL